nr:retrovirus-related Pol polyprotein from transposon TNT 1-94 [Tanacetum cinerariifolium]
MSKQCTKPKKKRDEAWFKDRVLLVQVQAQAQANGQVLQEEELEFLVDPWIAETSSTHSHALQDDLILSVIEQLKTQVISCTKINQDNNNVNDFLTAELERYKDQKEELRNIDRKLALEKQVKELNNITFKRNQSAQTVRMLTKPQFFYDHSTRQALGFQNPLYLKRAQQLKPKLYDGSVIQKTDAIVIHDFEETLMLEDESRSKILQKQNDPIMSEKKVITKPVDYIAFNQLLKDFGTHFVPQTELSAEQAFWSRYSVNSEEPNFSSSTTIVEVPKELPKVSMAVEQHCVEKNKFQDKMKNVLKDNERILEQAISVDIVNIVVHDRVNSTYKTVNVCERCVTIETELQRTLSKRNVMTHNRSEFVNQTLRDYYEEVGISHETSVARSPQQNGVIERHNRTLIEAAHMMLIYAQALLFLWEEAVATACFTLNRSIIRLRHGKTPYELLHSKLPDLSFFHVFGALCYPTNNSENLRYNLFSMGQFCDSDLEVAFLQHTCFIRNLDGVDHLTCSRENNLYSLSLIDMMASSPICILSKALKTKSWLWHHRLSHLNFGAINHLARKSLVRGLIKLKFEKDHLCSAGAMGKSKKKSHKPKSEDTNQEKLYVLHMDLCGPMSVESVNRKKYILVIVDDYSRFTWEKFLRSKDEASDFIIKFLKMIQLRLMVPIHRIRTDNGTEFVNQTLREYYEDVDIFHETLVDIFQLMFDELLNPPPSVDPQALEVIASIVEITPKTQSAVIPQDVEEDNLDIEVAHMGNDPLFGVRIPEVTDLSLFDLYNIYKYKRNVNVNNINREAAFSKTKTSFQSLDPEIAYPDGWKSWGVCGVMERGKKVEEMGYWAVAGKQVGMYSSFKRVIGEEGRVLWGFLHSWSLWLVRTFSESP